MDKSEKCVELKGPREYNLEYKLSYKVKFTLSKSEFKLRKCL